MAARNSLRSENSSPLPLYEGMYDTEDDASLVPLRRFKEPRPYLSLDTVYGRSYDADGGFVPEELVQDSSFQFRGFREIISTLFGSCFGSRRGEEADTISATEASMTSPRPWTSNESGIIFGVPEVHGAKAKDKGIKRLCRLESISSLDLNNSESSTENSHLLTPGPAPAQYGDLFGISEDSWVKEIYDGCTFYYYRGMHCPPRNASPKEAPPGTPKHGDSQQKIMSPKPVANDV